MTRYLYNMNGSMGAGNERFRRHSPENPSQSEKPSTSSVDACFSHELRQAIATTRQFFFNHQHPDGYWVAELEGDARFQSETILLTAFLGEENSELTRQCAAHLLGIQSEDGGWGRHTGGESDVSNTVKAYFALKLSGHNPSDEHMQKARIRALELGGADRVDGLTRFYLAILGQIPHSSCPVVPPQMLLMPKRFPINIYSISAWTRTVFVPLSIVSTLAPVRELTPDKGIKELFLKRPEQWGRSTVLGKKLSGNLFSTDIFFRTANALMRYCRRLGLTPLRRAGVEKARQWILEHCRKSDGPGTFFSPIVWTWIALKSLGYEDDSEEIRCCRRELESLVIRDEKHDSARIQPCKSPVWDTSLTLKALMMSGLTSAHPAVRKGVQWVRSRHIREKGDWSETVSTEPGGWCFGFNNTFYPDCDDTALALMVLAGRFDEAGTALPKVASRGKLTLRDLEKHQDEKKTSGILPPDLRLLVGEGAETLEEARKNALDFADTTTAMESGLRWLLAMQCKDGGWAAFDRDNDREFLNRLPFTDHGAMTDPATPDLTGRAMESLGRLGFRIGQNIEIDRAVAFLRNRQQADGSWQGRWGVNYIYGTWLALTGLAAVGVSKNDPMVVAGANWLLVHQHSSGGWGETPCSYDDSSLRGHGRPTASQTAWAVMGLIAAGKIDDPAAERGIRFLLNRQRGDGTWFEPEFTGTGLPGGVYLKYHYYSVYFPLMALSLYAAKTKAVNIGTYDKEIILRLEKLRIFSPENACYNNARPDDRPEEFELKDIPKSETEKPRPRNNPPTLRLFLG